MKNGDNAAGGFRDRFVLDKQRLPDQVGLLALGQREVLFRRDGGRTEQFRFEVVIRHQFVDAPESERAQGRHEEVRVHVDERRRVEHALNGGQKLAGQ